MDVAPEAVVRPTFFTPFGPFSAGRAFALDIGDRRLLVTCLHLFGPPAGFFHQDVPVEQLPSLVGDVGIGTLELLRPIDAEFDGLWLHPDANAGIPQLDVCAFAMRGGPPPLVLASEPPEHPEPPEPPELGSLAYLATPLRNSRASDPTMHIGMVTDTRGPIFSVELDGDPTLYGCSGAPVLDERGAVLGMLVRFRDADRVIAEVLPSQTLARLLASSKIHSFGREFGIERERPPKDVLGGVSWALGRGYTLASLEEAGRQLAEWNDKRAQWDPDAIVFPWSDVVIGYPARTGKPPHETCEGEVRLVASDGKPHFTALDLMFRMNNAVAQQLEDNDWDLFDHHFFEGLSFTGVSLSGPRPTPAYFIHFGS